MKITSIETVPIRVPLLDRVKIRASMGFHNDSPFLLLKIHTDEGITGLGEVSATPRWSGEDQVTAAHFIRTHFEPLALGEDPTEPERVMKKLSRAVAGNMFTKAGIEMALWDILGKAAGLPVYKLLGGAVRDYVTTK